VNAYLDRLNARRADIGSCLCLGLDPDPAGLPEGFTTDVAGIERFANMLLGAALPYAAAVKANLAFYEAFGSDGIAALERLRARVPPDVPFIADAKRADIGSTAARQATTLIDVLNADAVTANPYLGHDAVAPFLEHSDRFIYVLCHTSNPGANELQNLTTDNGEPLYIRVARLVSAWAEDSPMLGLVVGATAPRELAEVRAAAPELPFLVPGVGAQGGEVDAVMSHGGRSLLVNVSRGIASAAVNKPSNKSVEDAIAEAAAGWSAKLRC
jgi:orotidine-5'-phosphate decarboxylase